MALLRRKRTSNVDPLPDGAVALYRELERNHAFRAPQVSTTLVGNGLTAYGPIGRGRYDASKATTDHYLCNTYLYAAIRALAEDLSTLTLRVGADPDKAQNFDPKHPLVLALGPSGKPNPQTTARQLWMWTVAQWIINGRFVWEIDPTAEPRTYWPLVAHRVDPVPTKGGDKYFAAFDYEIGQGQKRRVQADRIVYHWRPSQMDWRQPESQLHSAKLDIDVAVMQDLYDVNFLRNDARPAAIIIHEAIENDDERDAFRRQFLDNHRGAKNAGKVAFAEVSEDGAPAKDALVVQTLGLSQKDAEFIKRYQAKVDGILLAVGVPRTRLGDATSKTFANAAEEMKMYWRNTVRHLAINFAEAINQYVAPLYGKEVAWFDFSENEYLREEPKFTVLDGIAAVKAGIISIEECRVEALGLPEAPLMGELHAPVAPPTPLGAPAPPAAIPPAPAASEPPPVAALPVAAGLTQAEIRALFAEMLSEQSKRAAIEVTEHIETADEARERRANQWRSFASTTAPLESRWERRIQRLFNQQRDAVIARITGKRGRQALTRDLGEIDPENIDVEAVFDKEFWRKKAQELGLDLHEDSTAAAFKAFEASIGLAFDVESPFAKKFILARANQLAGAITDTTYDGIKSALVEGVGEGESIPKLADRIRDLFDQTYANRATTVARTEVISGYNGSTTEAAAQTDGVVTEMEWISTLDDRTRGNSEKDEFDHLSVDGQVIEIGDSFDVSGELLAYPGDPEGSPANVINCRCTTAPVVGENRASNVVPIDRVARLAVAIHQGDCRVTDGRRAVAALRR